MMITAALMYVYMAVFFWLLEAQRFIAELRFEEMDRVDKTMAVVICSFVFAIGCGELVFLCWLWEALCPTPLG